MALFAYTLLFAVWLCTYGRNFEMIVHGGRLVRLRFMYIALSMQYCIELQYI